MRRTPTRRTGAAPDSPHSNTARSSRGRVFTPKEHVMGKYFVGWILGVPAIVLVVLWFFFR